MRGTPGNRRPPRPGADPRLPMRAVDSLPSASARFNKFLGHRRCLLVDRGVRLRPPLGLSLSPPEEEGG